MEVSYTDPSVCHIFGERRITSVRLSHEREKRKRREKKKREKKKRERERATMAASSAAGLLTACKENRNTPVQLLGILNVSAKSKGHKATRGGGERK